MILGASPLGAMSPGSGWGFRTLITGIVTLATVYLRSVRRTEQV